MKGGNQAALWERLAFQALEADGAKRMLHGGTGPGTGGWPDFLVELPDGWAFVEVKGPDDKLNPKQIELLFILREMGNRVLIAQVERTGHVNLVALESVLTMKEVQKIVRQRNKRDVRVAAQEEKRGTYERYIESQRRRR